MFQCTCIIIQIISPADNSQHNTFSTTRTCSIVVGRNGRFYVQKKRVRISFYTNHDPFLATFDATPSPHGRINAPSLLLAFAHIHGEAGKPTEGICSAVVGRNGPFLCCAEGVD
jgi:exosome complex RNA-binding protein Rrp4